jgi:hypothetical protein
MVKGGQIDRDDPRRWVPPVDPISGMRGQAQLERQSIAERRADQNDQAGRLAAKLKRVCEAMHEVRATRAQPFSPGLAMGVIFECGMPAAAGHDA